MEKEKDSKDTQHNRPTASRMNDCSLQLTQTDNDSLKLTASVRDPHKTANPKDTHCSTLSPPLPLRRSNADANQTIQSRRPTFDCSREFKPKANSQESGNTKLPQRGPPLPPRLQNTNSSKEQNGEQKNELQSPPPLPERKNSLRVPKSVGSPPIQTIQQVDKKTPSSLSLSDSRMRLKFRESDAKENQTFPKNDRIENEPKEKQTQENELKEKPLQRNSEPKGRQQLCVSDSKMRPHTQESDSKEKLTFQENDRIKNEPKEKLQLRENVIVETQLSKENKSDENSLFRENAIEEEKTHKTEKELKVEPIVIKNNTTEEPNVQEKETEEKTQIIEKETGKQPIFDEKVPKEILQSNDVVDEKERNQYSESDLKEQPKVVDTETAITSPQFRLRSILKCSDEHSSPKTISEASRSNTMNTFTPTRPIGVTFLKLSSFENENLQELIPERRRLATYEKYKNESKPKFDSDEEAIAFFHARRGVARTSIYGMKEIVSDHKRVFANEKATYLFEAEKEKKKPKQKHSFFSSLFSRSKKPSEPVISYPKLHMVNNKASIEVFFYTGNVMKTIPVTVETTPAQIIHLCVEKFQPLFPLEMKDSSVFDLFEYNDFAPESLIVSLRQLEDNEKVLETFASLNKSRNAKIIFCPKGEKNLGFKFVTKLIWKSTLLQKPVNTRYIPMYRRRSMSVGTGLDLLALDLHEDEPEPKKDESATEGKALPAPGTTPQPENEK